jgi:MEDS: MEthanogen/methylotroph, DcmR Sensory domain/Histidine kinase-like ATPase domain
VSWDFVGKWRLTVAVAPGVAGTTQRGHVVQFYTRDWELAAGAGQYLADALAGGCAVVVAATLAHRHMFESYLAGVDADVAAAQAEGRYQAIDAAALLHRFAVAGEVDPASFDAEVGQVIRTAGAAGRPVRVYGEMVALLWEEGQLNAALELESRWNDLAREIPFGLYCGYPEAPASGADQRAALAEVCRLHAAVVGTPPATARPVRTAPAPARSRATRSFPHDRDAPRQARHFALDLLRGWRLEQRCGVNLASDVAIVVSELATNAVRHAGSGFTVSLMLAADVVQVRVEDGRPLAGSHGDPPLPVSPDHGLGLVDAVAGRWGVQPADGGKTVWAELPLT